MIDNYDQFYKINSTFLRPKTYPLNVENHIKADWLFLLHTLNFSLWYPKGIKQWRVKGKGGFSGLCNGIKRAIDVSIMLIHYSVT